MQEVLKILEQLTNKYKSEPQIVALDSLTNAVFKVSYEEIHLVLKIYKPTLEMFIDRNLELELIKNLSKNGIYPELIEISQFHRMEKFINNAITAKNTPETLHQLVTILGSFTKDYNFIALEHQNNKLSKTVPFLFNVFREIYKNKQSNLRNNIKINEETIIVIEKALEMEKEILEIMKDIPLVLNHNDVYFPNILQSTINKNEITLLDFEFSSLNYLGYDLANIFNEITAVYGEEFGINETFELEEAFKKELIKKYFLSLENLFDCTSLDKLEKYVEKGRMLSHLFWMFVGLQQIDDPKLTMDMNNYVNTRYIYFIKYFKNCKT